MSKRILPVLNRIHTDDQNTLLFMQLHTLPAFASFFLFSSLICQCITVNLNRLSKPVSFLSLVDLGKARVLLFFLSRALFMINPWIACFSSSLETYEAIICLRLSEASSKLYYWFRQTLKKSPALLSKVASRNTLLAECPLYSIPMLTEYLDEENKENRTTEKC